MNYAILMKVFGLLTTSSLFVTYATYFFNPGLFDKYENVHIYAINEVVNNAPTDPLNHGETKNFECQININSEDKKFDCQIHEFTTFANKQADYENFDKDKNIKDAEISTFAVANNFFRITTSNKNWNWTKHKDIKIDIVKKTSSQPPGGSTGNNKYTTLTTKFATLGNQRYQKAPDYFLFKTEIKEDFVKGSADYQCTWTKTEDWKNCSVYDFASPNEAKSLYGELKFTENLNIAATIENKKFYLLKFNPIDDTKKPSAKIKNDPKEKNEITLNSLIHTFYDAVKKQIFILD